jgi:hypothetical protein
MSTSKKFKLTMVLGTLGGIGVAVFLCLLYFAIPSIPNDPKSDRRPPQLIPREKTDDATAIGTRNWSKQMTNIVLRRYTGIGDFRDKALFAMTNFIANATNAGLKFDPGDLNPAKPIRLDPLGSSATAQTKNAVFGFQFPPSTLPVVGYITSIGPDVNGADRDLYALDPAGRSLKTLSDANLYPIRSSSDQTLTAVMNFVTLQLPNSDYVLSDSHRYAYPDPKPFMVYVFTPPGEYKKANPVNAITVTVRDGGTDLQPGQPELIAYEDDRIYNATGYIEEPKFEKPSADVWNQSSGLHPK